MPPGVRARARRSLEHLLHGVAWLGVAILVALGAAGVVAGLDHQPGSPARPELTWTGDQVVAPELDAATADLAVLAERVDSLAEAGRRALTALGAADMAVLDVAIEDGSALALEIATQVGMLRDRLESIEAFGAGSELRLSPATRARHAALLDALAGTGTLVVDWDRVAEAGRTAALLSTLLEAHDAFVAAAVDAGRDGAFDEAIARIDEATASLDRVGALRNGLVGQVDVTTLDDLLRRSRAHDDALRDLYEASAASPDAVTPEIREAALAERAARAQLPREGSARRIVLSDIARDRLSRAVVAIDEVRGRIAEALEPVR